MAMLTPSFSNASGGSLALLFKLPAGISVSSSQDVF
jgi:hypothetical protein